MLFAGGGTSGHVAPLLSVMEAVQKRNPSVRCVYVGTKTDVQSLLIEESPLAFEKKTIAAGKLHRFLTFRQLGELARLAKGMVQAEILIRQVKPDVVFCKGSMVSVPVAVAAARHGIPVFSHETDVVPGLANRIISRYTKTIFTSYPVGEYSKLPAEKLLYTGQPVRSEFYAVENKQGSVPHLTVIGGSQGARRINQLVSEIWEPLAKRMEVTHIAGSNDFLSLQEKMAAFPEEVRSRVRLVEFVGSELPVLFAQSTVVVSRAGGTIGELAALGKATILIPLSTAAQNHQWANAAMLQKAGAVMVLDEKTGTSADLLETIEELIDNSALRSKLEQTIAGFAKRDAAAKMAEVLDNAL